MRRIPLGAGARVDYHPRWLYGHLDVFDHLHRCLDWKAQRRMMYERMVDVPRLVAEVPVGTLPVIDQAACTLSAHYGWPLDRVSAALYRDGRDSVALHGDRMGPLREDCVIAVLSRASPVASSRDPRAGSTAPRCASTPAAATWSSCAAAVSAPTSTASPSSPGPARASACNFVLRVHHAPDRCPGYGLPMPSPRPLP